MYRSNHEDLNRKISLQEKKIHVFTIYQTVNVRHWASSRTTKMKRTYCHHPKVPGLRRLWS